MNSIIELRNKDAYDITKTGNFGDWTTNLQQKMTLNQGDALICKQAYVDTKASSDMKIVIPHDLNIVMQYYIYNINYRGAVTTGTGADEETDPATSWIIAFNPIKGSIFARTDAKKYIMCEKQTLNPDKFYHISTVRVNSVYLFQNMGGFEVVFRYYNTAGNLAKKFVLIPHYESSGNALKTNLDINVNIIYDKTRIPAGQTDPIECFLFKGNTNVPDLAKRFDTPSTTKEGDSRIYQDTQMHRIPEGAKLNGATYTPKLQTSTFTIEANNYDPDDLTALMNRRMTEIGTNITSTNLTDNNFLVQVGGGANSHINNFIEMTDGSAPNPYGYEYNNTSGNFMVWAGASQMEITFDPENQSFGFNYAHTPLYQDAQISVGFADTSHAGLQPVRNYGGILFHSLQSYVRNKDGTNGVVFSFWDNILGFDLRPNFDNGDINPNCILTSFEVKLKQPNGTDDYEVNAIPSGIPVFPNLPQAKKQFTQGFQGLDTAVQKGNANDDPTKTTPFYHPLKAGSGTTLFSTTNDTDPILAGDSILASDSPDLAFGYFLIEVQAQFLNNYITAKENKNHIVAIMSRYYSESSYTSSSSDASLVYTHNSPEPVIINSFKCRVLNSDKILASNIGKDNTIFLELVKAQPKPNMKAIEANKK